MDLKKEIDEAYRKNIENDMERNREGALLVRRSLEHSPLCWDGIIDKTVQIPKILD